MAKKANRKMKLNRTYIHTSLLGHSIRFIKGEPTSVPPLLYGEILAIGGEFVDGEGLAAPAEEGNHEPIDPVEREARIDAAIEAIVERNDVDDFTAASSPKADAVSRECGFKVSAKDVAKAWQRRADRIEAEKNS
jgi:hypothetical protein